MPSDTTNIEEYTFDEFKELYEEALAHVGTAHEGSESHSGRYPWGSGEHPFQRYKDFISTDYQLRQKGLSKKERAKFHGITTVKYDARLSYLSAVNKYTRDAKIAEMKDKGMSNLQIAKELGIGESSIRQALKRSERVREEIIFSVTSQLREKLETKDSEGNDILFVDVGKGCGNRMNVAQQRIINAVEILQDEKYNVYNLFVPNSSGNNTTVRVLAKPGVTQDWCYQHLDRMGEMNAYTEDGGKTFKKVEPPVAVSMSRISIRYDDDDKNGQGDGVSGTLRDGIIELRRGVPDLNLGDAHYAQVRVAVDGGEHGQLYLKGMAMYADDLPDGVDIRFNSNKKRGTPIEKVLKKQQAVDPDDPDGNPFGSTIKEQKNLHAIQRTYIDPVTGEEKTSALNIVNEEGDWEKWSRNVASQMLGKQSPRIARQQLDIYATSKEKELDDILALTNPVLKKTMLDSYAGSCDAAAVHLKAAAFPGQQTHVILPLPHIAKDEIFAPKYEDGEEVILVRYPHSGPFEIPRLRVNNRSRIARSIIGSSSRDAVGIHPEAAAQLSGADFDGDTVLVIPTKGRNFKTAPLIEALRGFDPKTAYATTDDERDSGKVPLITTKRSRSQHMGKITNLITDMMVTGEATEDEIARAVKHSMVIVDAYKHKLNWKQSEIDNDIAGLRAKYQPADPNDPKSKPGGARTIFSRAKSQEHVPKRKSYYRIDPETGAKIYADDPDNKKWVPKKVDKDSGEVLEWKQVDRTTKSTKMAEADDAYALTSGGSRDNVRYEIEAVYADHANRMKALANRARKESLRVETYTVSPTAAKVYAKEVAHLKSQLNDALKRAPLERKAQAATAAEMKIFDHDNPGVEAEDRSKKRSQVLKRMRALYGADKADIHISDREWEAIQAHAVSKTALKDIFRFCDQDKLKERAMPKDRPAMSRGDVSRAKSLLKNGYTTEEVAKFLGVSESTVTRYVYDGQSTSN